MKTYDELFAEFKRIHPNNKEEFAPTETNVARWKYHISAAHSAPKFPSAVGVIAGRSALARLSAGRQAAGFFDLPYIAQRVFEACAQCFVPGTEVFAVGSWVNGSWVWNGQPIFVYESRMRIGKTNSCSDFDIFVAPGAQQMAKLPAAAEVVRAAGIDKKIKIPMWDFAKLPEEKREEFLQAYNSGDIDRVVAMHDEYRLSEYSYCCDLSGIGNWVEWAIKNGLLDGPKDEKHGITGGPNADRKEV